MDRVVLNELRHDTDHDDQWDPLAPVAYRDEAPAEVIDEAAPVPSDAPYMEEPPRGEDSGDGGVSDGMGISRVWLEDGKLTRLRVSSNWRARLSDETVSLADCINAAIMAASLDLEHESEDSFPEVPESELVPISSSRQADELFEDLRLRQESALQRLQEESVGDGRHTRAHANGATAVLDEAGRLMRVEFADSWLARSETTSINNSVVAAAQKAYRNYVPTTRPAKAEFDRLAYEHTVLHASYRAWMIRGDWR